MTDTGMSDADSTVGSLTVIAGPMFSGKTTELIRFCDEQTREGRRVLNVIWAGDTRSGVSLKSHDGAKIAAVPVGRMEEILSHPDYAAADVIVVDEGHFYVDLCVVAAKMAFTDGKAVRVAGLYADFSGMPFGGMSFLMAHATEVRFVRAYCFVCGQPASCTLLRGNPGNSDICDSGARILVGGSELYAPVCAGHFMAAKTRTVSVRPEAPHGSSSGAIFNGNQ